MSEKTRKSGSNMDQGLVQLQREEYTMLVNKLQNMETRLQAQTNLHMILHEKEQVAEQYRDKALQYEAALMQAECRIANLLKMSVNQQQNTTPSGSDFPKFESGDLQSMEKIQQDIESLKLSAFSSGFKEGSDASYSPKLRARGSSQGNDQDLEMDCGLESLKMDISGFTPMNEPVKRKQTSFIADQSSSSEVKHDHKRSTQNVSKSVHGTDKRDQSKLVGFSQEINTKSTEIPRPSAIKRTDVDISTETTKTSLEQLLSFPKASSLPFVTPGISRTMFDNVVKENLRLKRTLDNVEQRTGTDMKTMLDIAEYEDIIQQLRTELVSQHMQHEQLQHSVVAHSNSNKDAVMVTICELQKKIVAMEKTITTKQGLVDIYNKQYEKLKNENTELRAALGKVEKASVAERESTDGKTSTLPNTQTHAQTAQSEVEGLKRVLSSMKQKYERQIAELQMDLTKSKAEADSLQQKCQEYADSVQNLLRTRRTTDDYPISMAELRHQNETLKKETGVLKSELDKALEERSMFETQAAIFQEDFNAEQSNIQQARKEYEKKLADQQIHIRRLGQECEKTHILLDKKVEELRTLKSQIQNFQAAFQVVQPPCAISAGPAIGPTSWMQHAEVVADCPPDDTTEPQEVMSQSKESWECPRCEREFNNQTAYDEHVRKCSDV